MYRTLDSHDHSQHHSLMAERPCGADLQSIDWMWERLAETGPHGQRYVEKFEPEYRSLVYNSQSVNNR